MGSGGGLQPGLSDMSDHSFKRFPYDESVTWRLQLSRKFHSGQHTCLLERANTQ